MSDGEENDNETNEENYAFMRTGFNQTKQESDNNAHKLMIVLSDGSPSADKYRGATAYEHTRKCVKYAETQGWSIIQVGFSGATEWIMDKRQNS